MPFVSEETAAYTRDRYLANLGTASRLVANQLNLDAVPVSAWSQDDRIVYVQSLANTILANQSEFDAQSIENARLILGQNFDGMALDDFVNTAPDGRASLAKIFVDDLGDNAFEIAAAPVALGAAAYGLVNKLASTTSNLGDAAERLTAAAARGAEAANWFLPVALVAFVAMLTVSAKKKAVAYAS